MASQVCGAKIFESGKFCCARPEQDSKRCHAHRDTACYCCGEVDDPDGKGPAINTGFCAECNSAGCPEALTGSLCKRVGSDMSGRVDEMARLGRWAATGARPPYPAGDVPGCVAEICEDLHAQLTELREAKAAASCCDESAALRLSLAQMDKINRDATTDGIATGLSRALVALEARAKQLDVALSAEIRRRAEYGSLVIDGYEDCLGRRDEARGNCALIRSLLEATVD